MLLSIPRLKEFVGRNLLAKPNLLGKSLQLVLRLLAVLMQKQGTERFLYMVFTQQKADLSNCFLTGMHQKSAGPCCET